MTYKTILVPYDGSKPSNRALTQAIEVAKLSGAKVILANIVTEILYPNYLSFRGAAVNVKSARSLAKEMYYEMKEIAQKLLESAKVKCEDEKVKVETAVGYGNVTGSIIDLIKRKNIDLVVMGTTGLSGISKLKSIGSVARSISEKSPCPVLLVH